MIKPRKTGLRIHTIGTLALESLSTEQGGSLFGTTSQGIFTMFAGKKIVFLSYGEDRGPLTANLSGDSHELANLSAGGSFTVSPERITFLNPEISVSTANVKSWQPPTPSGSFLNVNERRKRIANLAIEAYQKKRGERFAETLPVLADFPPLSADPDSGHKDLVKQIHTIRKDIHEDNLPSLERTILSLLGLGGGLTPSGDDFIMGLLLSLNRWNHLFVTLKDLSQLNQQVLLAAHDRTTVLSSNLIEAATLGLADERLIRAVDFIAVDKYRQHEVLQGLLSWGNSSGVDALAGMITAFSGL